MHNGVPFMYEERLSAQNLAASGAATCQNLAAVTVSHTRAETMAAGANQSAGLECAFHISRSLFCNLYINLNASL
jgi:hypothetical protein